MDKKRIRELALKARNQLTEGEVREKSNQIIERLENEVIFQKAEHILFYYSHQNEVNTQTAIKKWISQKKIYLPKLNSESHMMAYLCGDLRTLEKNRYNILEPGGRGMGGTEKLDLIIIPGLAFDLKGNRIGMGKGYYDRFLAHQKGVFKIALAYEKQIFDELPKEPYDEPVDMIITEKRIINCLPKIDD